MKLKPFLVAMLIMAASAGAQAQSVKFGIKGGADINKINGKSFKDQFSYGYQLGVFTQINVNDKWGIQPEILLSQINVDTTSSFSDIYKINGFPNAKLKYLKIPLLLNYNANQFVSLQLGPQFGVLLDKDKTAIENGQSAFKGGDFSMVGGIQLNILKLRLYGRYALGLSNLNDITSSEKWKSQSFQVGLGITL